MPRINKNAAGLKEKRRTEKIIHRQTLGVTPKQTEKTIKATIKKNPHLSMDFSYRFNLIDPFVEWKQIQTIMIVFSRQISKNDPRLKKFEEEIRNAFKTIFLA